ncbi:MAG: hypothetical protein Q8R83_01820 [Legionellaceae bacterium]|nr:hypothetical protein [Legionellaceae bacterium]
MTKRMVKTGSGLGSIVWVLPNPVWNTLVLATRAVTQIYTICNTSNTPVTIATVDLVQGDDSRLNIIGGTCSAGMTLAPNTTATVEIEACPRALGTIKQVLCINHSGSNSPLWIDIIFAVVRQSVVRKASSMLVDETSTMERQRRLNEQDGHRRLARVNAREHSNEQTQQIAPEGELQNNILQNPWLNSQRFDGVDPNLNPEPPLNTEARREFDNERREQEMEKQLRLGNMPKFSTTPKPQGY